MAVETLPLNMSSNIAVAYIRVSTEEQDEKGFSLDYQKELAQKYIIEYNTNIEKNINAAEEKKTKKLILEDNMIFKEVKPASTVFTNNIDNDLKESLKNRPELQKILDLAQQKKFGHLILLSRDRLTRDFEQFIALKYLLNKNNIKIHYTRVGENLDLEDKKINRFIDNILASVAELEANVISVRVKNGGRICILNGYWAGGKPPLGYNLRHIKIPGRKKSLAKLSTSIYEKNLIVTIFRLYNLGYGYRKIANIMNLSYSNIKWTKSKIEGIIKNESYTGRIAWDRKGGRRHPGNHETPTYSSLDETLSFITEKQWDALAKLRAYKTQLKDPKYFDTPYLLKNKLVCGKCGQKLKTKNYGKNKAGENICVYKCVKNIDNKSELILNKHVIENLVIEELKHTFIVSV